MENRTETRMDMVPFVFNDNMVRGCLDDRGEPWFVARDVCRVLDIANNRDAVTGLDDDEKITQRAVKPRSSGRGYKAHLDWNFDFPAFVC